MKAVKPLPKHSYLSPRGETLLSELREECQHILKLMAQLETPGLVEAQVEVILGELSAAVLHLHEHTSGLDKVIDEDRGEGNA